MRPNANGHQQRAQHGEDVEHDVRPSTGVRSMTSRGTKYWDSGAIPLIAPEILGNIIAEVADLGIVISETGNVLSVIVNPLYDSFRTLERWEGRDIRTALTTESVPKFDRRLNAFLEGEENVRPVELNHTDSVGSWEFPVRYSLHRIGPDGALLMLGRDLRPVAEMQQQLVKAQVALEQDYEIQRENDTRFRVLMDATTDAMVFASAKTGIIKDVNSAALSMFDMPLDDLIGRPLSGCFVQRDAGDLLSDLTTNAIADAAEPLRAMLRSSDEIVSLTPVLFRAAGDRMVLCRIAHQDAANIRDDDLSANLRGMYHGTPDAIVFASDDGRILSANDGFLSLVDTAHDISVRGKTLTDYLQRGSVDVKVMIENAARNGRMRAYATKIAGDYGSPRAIEISVTRLMAGQDTVFAFAMRETGSTDKARDSVGTPAEAAMLSVKELVGQATLKEIVAETTNVVEKMCIETAVTLTMNNRVAAAEMLGLSRQSLYVKLRKFGLLARDGAADK